jgi:hypothetical protein
VFLAPDGAVERAKVLSTPEDYSLGIARGLESTLAGGALRIDDITQVMHGTTVATNAILEGKGARVALITTAGFRDCLEIRRLRMPVLYDIRWRKPATLVPRWLRFEVDERIDHRGEIERAMDEAAARAVIDRILAARVDAIAICLLNSYANGIHERRLRELLRERHSSIPVSLSSELLPEIREYERTSTTVVNAYVLPVVRHYLERLATQLAARAIVKPLTIIQSMRAMSAAAPPSGPSTSSNRGRLPASSGRRSWRAAWVLSACSVSTWGAPRPRRRSSTAGSSSASARSKWAAASASPAASLAAAAITSGRRQSTSPKWAPGAAAWSGSTAVAD